MNNILVFPGHPRRPFPGLFVETVLLRRPRLRLQLTTLMQTDTREQIRTTQTQAGVPHIEKGKTTQVELVN